MKISTPNIPFGYTPAIVEGMQLRENTLYLAGETRVSPFIAPKVAADVKAILALMIGAEYEKLLIGAEYSKVRQAIDVLERVAELVDSVSVSNTETRHV